MGDQEKWGALSWHQEVNSASFKREPEAFVFGILTLMTARTSRWNTVNRGKPKLWAVAATNNLWVVTWGWDRTFGKLCGSQSSLHVVITPGYNLKPYSWLGLAPQRFRWVAQGYSLGIEISLSETSGSRMQPRLALLGCISGQCLRYHSHVGGLHSWAGKYTGLNFSILNMS